MLAQCIYTRFATSRDNILLADLGARTFEDTYANDNDAQDIATYIAASFSPHIQAQQLATANTTFLIAEINRKSVGYAQLQLNSSTHSTHSQQPMELARLYADQRWVGQGVGQTLMASCLDLAHTKGCDTIWLSVWEHNLRAIQFYQKWGFTIVSTQKFQVGTDIQNDFLMQRSLQAANRWGKGD